MVSLLLAVLLLLVADFDFGFGFDVSAKAAGVDITTIDGVSLGEAEGHSEGTTQLIQSQPKPDRDFEYVGTGVHYDLETTQPEAQTPTAYTTGGGGFWTMTDSMGIIRAWHESNILEHNTTHFGGKF